MPNHSTTPENCFPCMNPKSGTDSDSNSLDRYFGGEFLSISESFGDATDSDYDGDDEDDKGDDESDDEMLSDEMLFDNGSSVSARRLTNLSTVRSNPESVAKLRNTHVAVSLYDVVSPSILR
ncbi:hypothetical protein COCC4DRAFT_64511 [Bipolaris maydis ATCC 48331]|uniref:Uncharacterized protein n=2 Tax=Cochliobolus heterostrophus TaxID=5016 RepID=M2TJC0_COCH5|nr:uncharacterized protein COCC4DRAFT_64511 [Bipolaris maydis ATCC 48331]EMD97525.1 hypothetical protein COCHEDRAFT_1087139 [Bipolaris maydis C5]ENI01337.1 hypothetical protein COCC4DRAFT_64511 [Bipolaris maydis ATCC 48331]